MKRQFPIYALLTMVATMFTAACNTDSDDDEYNIEDPAENAVMINSFNIVKNDSILADLDSVFFSIDLDRAMVFNADSLPKGTKVDRLQLNIGLSSVSKAEITMPTDRGADTVVNYLTNSSDSINFSRGSVTLHLESYNGKYKRDYTIFVNVHKVKADSMVWGELSSTTLPTSLSTVTTQRTVEYQGKALCFTENSGSYCRATADNPSGNWTKESVTLPAGANISTLTAGQTKLFVIDSSDNLYESTDMGSSWTSTGASMHHIYGCIEDQAIGVKGGTGSYTYATYPATTESAIESGCPVEGTSPALVFTTEWSTQPMMIIAGGIDAQGNKVGGTWAYDGNQWAEISMASLPALEAPVIVPYYAYKGDKYWKMTKQSVLLAFGGISSANRVNPTVYISYDRGVHWATAPDLLQLPQSFQPGAYAQALVFDTKYTTGQPAISSGWSAPIYPEIPVWSVRVQPTMSRASTPITSWECPYIYLFGGTDASGKLNTKVYRGVINRLAFKPLQ